jgi:folylpolyglutamate synthase
VLITFRTTQPVARILIFSLITDQRNGAAVFERLATSLAGSEVQYAIFTTYERDQDSDSRNGMHIYVVSLALPLADSSSDSQRKILEMPSQDQQVYAEIWKRAHPDSTIFFEPTIQGALEMARKIGKDHGSMQTLVTGSQHLVGPALSLLQMS